MTTLSDKLMVMVFVKLDNAKFTFQHLIKINNASYKPTDLQQQSRLSVGSLFPQYSHLPIAWKNEYMTHYAMNGICEYSYNKNHLFVQPA